MRKRHVCTTVAASFLLLAPAVAARAEEIRTVSERLDEKVESISIQQGRAVLKTQSRSIPLEQVKQIRFDDRAISDTPGAKVFLTNKDEVRGQVQAATANNQGFQLKAGSVGQVNVDLDSAVAIFFDVPPETERKYATKHLDWVGQPNFAGRPDKDAVYIKAGGKVEGLVSSISNKGIEVDAGKALGKLTFALKEVELVVFGNAGGKPPGPPAGTIVRVKTSDGSVVSGAIKELGSGRILIDGNPLGGGNPVTIQLKDMVELYVVNGAFIYLSDLTPSKVDESLPPGMAYRADWWGWKRDREVHVGGRLRLGGRTYDKGLGVHTFSSLTFPLGGAYKKFRTLVGIDDCVKYYNSNPNAGRIVFRVLVDGKPAKELPDGAAKKRNEPPQELEVDVSGAKEITLIADYGGFMHVMGRADWADAHLVK